MTRQPTGMAKFALFVSLGTVQTAAFLPHGVPHAPLSAGTHLRRTTTDGRRGRRGTLEEGPPLRLAACAALLGCRSPCNASWNGTVEKRCATCTGRRVMRLSEGGGGGDESNALLLRVDFEAQADVEKLRAWIRRYPFGTALPVQPFSLVETETGLDVVFRKKPTLERGSQDGGLRFAVEESVFEEGVDLPACATLTMRRISEGQEIRKMFAERIVVKAIVKALAGDGTPPAPDKAKVRTVLHEGLV